MPRRLEDGSAWALKKGAANRERAPGKRMQP